MPRMIKRTFGSIRSWVKFFGAVAVLAGIALYGYIMLNMPPVVRVHMALVALIVWTIFTFIRTGEAKGIHQPFSHGQREFHGWLALALIMLTFLTYVEAEAILGAGILVFYTGICAACGIIVKVRLNRTRTRPPRIVRRRPIR